MRRAGRGAALGLAGVVLLALPVLAQAPACVTGRGLVTLASIGSEVMQEGVGFGAVRLGNSVADVERAWGAPAQCQRDRSNLTYTYLVSDDGATASGLRVGVVIEQGRVSGIAAILMLAGQRVPPLRTERGARLLAPLSDVSAIYGPSANPEAGVWTYLAAGVLFVPSQQLVTGIWIFPPNALPYPLRLR